MRETRTTQTSIFEYYAPHERGEQLCRLSAILDEQPQILALLEKDLVDEGSGQTGRKGLSVDSVLRCLLLKQSLNVSYDDLSFVLLDSPTYRTFARLECDKVPGRSSLQRNIRQIQAQTLESIFSLLNKAWHHGGDIDLSAVRIDSTVVRSDIAPPSDSRLLDDAVRVLSRYLEKCYSQTGHKVRFRDHTRRSKKLAFAIFHAKKEKKEALYIDHLKIAAKVMQQAQRACEQVRNAGPCSESTHRWLNDISHYHDLAVRVVAQTGRRVIYEEKVPADEKVVSLFEEHTDIIIKSNRGVEYGHKINLASDARGLITRLAIEDGNPTDIDRYLSMIDGHALEYGRCPHTVVTDGGYASLENLQGAKAAGVKRAVFHKKRGLTLTAMGVKSKTFEALRNFRAGIEGNISELKRAFGMDKARWKSLEGFKSYVWSSVLCYNLTRMARIRAG